MTLRPAPLIAASLALAALSLLFPSAPTYDPWDQRVCFVPDGDLFEAIKTGRAEVVTDRIDCFTATGVRLASGRELAADVVVSAARGAAQGAQAGLAGEREDCSKLARGLPSDALLQVREDIFSRERASAYGRPAYGRPAQLTYGALQRALGAILDGGWNPACDTDAGAGAGRPSSPSSSSARAVRSATLAPLLLADALQANPDGVVLYSTTQPERLSTVDRAIYHATRESDELRALREYLAEPVRAAAAG